MLTSVHAFSCQTTAQQQKSTLHALAQALPLVTQAAPCSQQLARSSAAALLAQASSHRGGSSRHCARQRRNLATLRMCRQGRERPAPGRCPRRTRSEAPCRP